MRRLLLILLGLWGCGEQAELAQSMGALMPGELDEAGAWPGVGHVITGRRGTCSGTLVHADGDSGLVLTAAHCIFDLPSHHGFFGLAPRGFRFGPTQDTEVQIGRVGLHPRFGWGRRTNPLDPWPLTVANDFAIFEVSGLPPEAADWVIPVWDDVEGEIAVGAAITLVGFGRPTLGERQVGSTRVGQLDSSVLQGAPLIFVRAQDGSNGCPGDSGGPYILETLDGPRVVAVNSAGNGDCTTADAFSYGGDARSALPLIRSVIELNRPPMPATCAACAATSGFCNETRNALVGAVVAPFEDCISARTAQGTFSKCSREFPAIRTAYDAHWACLVAACGEGVCTDAARIMTLCEYAHDGAGPCDTCMTASCCGLASTCVNDPVCRACANTTMPDAACLENTRLRALYTCLAGPCEAECAPYVGEVIALVLPPDAGVPDVGGPDAGIPDVGAPDVGPADLDDAGTDAAAFADAEAPTADEGSDGCQTRPGPGSAWLLALAVFVRRRRLQP